MFTHMSKKENDKQTVGDVTGKDPSEILNNQSETRGIDAGDVSLQAGTTESPEQPTTKVEVVEKKTGTVEAGEKAVGTVKKILMWIASKIFVIIWSMFWIGIIMNVFGLSFDTHTIISYILFGGMLYLIAFWTPFYGE